MNYQEELKRVQALPEIGNGLAVGADIVALGTVGISDKLTLGKVYQAIYGLEAGIFADRPFVTVICNTGKHFSCHASRFRLPE